jgi:steroid 5-alpha reductase family enzyme
MVFLSGACFLALLRVKYPLNLRHLILISFILIYILRLCLTLFVFLQRKLVWREALTIGIVMSIIIYVLLYTGRNNRTSYMVDIMPGIFFYIIGSFINTCSEFQRHNWKKIPEHKGHIYKYGLFRYSMHINYFGDVLLFAGLSIITGTYWTLMIPISMLLNFMIFIIPNLDTYLAEKYGDEFIEYSGTTKKLIPYIY